VSDPVNTKVLALRRYPWRWDVINTKPIQFVIVGVSSLRCFDLRVMFDEGVHFGKYGRNSELAGLGKLGLRAKVV
jgi:hypothetical protein